MLLHHWPSYQPLQVTLQRAYLSSAYLVFPDLTPRLPARKVSNSRAYPINDPVHKLKVYYQGVDICCN